MMAASFLRAQEKIMGWSLASKIAKKKVGHIFNAKSPDKSINWPLSATIGQSISLDPTPFILAGWDPPPTSLPITALGHSQWASEIFRLYLQDEVPACLTIYQGENHEEREAIFFRLEDEMQPQSEDDFAEWLDDHEGHLGRSPFYTPNDEEFLRLFDDNRQEKIPPYETVEHLYETPGSESFRSIDMTFMLYGKQQSEIQEQLWVVFEDSGNYANIKIYRGLPINLASL